ncbi:MAG: CDP-archaeol synthase [Pseudomonadales bacterium]
MTLAITLKVVLLSLAANGTPILGKRLLGTRLAVPLDGGRMFFDGRPILGRSKTLRGLLLSIAACALTGSVLGYPWSLGAAFGAASMAGDALSSFVKRRLDIPPSGRFMGLDQIPEILLPLWLCRDALALDWPSIVVLTVLLAAGSLLLSPLMYRIGLRDRPY